MALAGGPGPTAQEMSAPEEKKPFAMILPPARFQVEVARREVRVAPEITLETNGPCYLALAIQFLRPGDPTTGAIFYEWNAAMKALSLML
jgi:hypothetical protein